MYLSKLLDEYQRTNLKKQNDRAHFHSLYNSLYDCKIKIVMVLKNPLYIELLEWQLGRIENLL